MRADLDRIRLTRGAVLQTATARPEFIYFPIDCLVSLVVTLESGDMVEAATIGNDGYVGISTVLGIEPARLTAMVQIAGEAFRMPVDAFQALMNIPELRSRLQAYASRALATISQSVACMAFHPVQERLARWLLLVRDGLQHDEFPLTQDFLAVMLGVHRPTVTIAVRILESAGVISHRRGVIKIVDVPALQDASCECYEVSVGGGAIPGGLSLLHLE